MTDRHTTNTTPALTPEREVEIRKRVTDPCRHAAAIALHAGEDVRVLLAELDRVRAERDQLDANLLRAEEVGARTRERHDRERAEIQVRLGVALEQQAAEVRAAALTEGADAIDAETRQAKADGVLEPDKYRPCRDASAQLRHMAATPGKPAPSA